MRQFLPQTYLYTDWYESEDAFLLKSSNENKAIQLPTITRNMRKAHVDKTTLKIFPVDEKDCIKTN